MGCIVNGPGKWLTLTLAMSVPDLEKLTLYVEKSVKSAIPENDAVDRLVDLIQEEGKWIDP